MENKEYPLDGIRVVEMGTHVAIPNAARVMADFGAQIIKIEAPKGDGWRYPGSEYDVPIAENENPFFTMQNANKQLACIDITKSSGLKVLDRLLSEADVFMTSVRMQSLKKRGLDFETLHERYPSLIYCCNTGYGDAGAEAKRPGFDQAAFWSRTGAACDWVEEGGSPIRPSLAFGDLATGAQLLSGVLMALIGREHTGKGTMVTASLLGCGIWYNSNAIISAQEGYGHQYPESRKAPKNPFTSFYQASDGGWFTLVAFVAEGGYEGLLRRMFPIFEMNDWLEELNAGTFCHDSGEITQRLHEVIRTKPSWEWHRIFQEADIVYEKCAHFSEVSRDQQAWDNQYFEDVMFQNGNHSILPNSPIKMSAYKKKCIKAMGVIGEDTCSVLSEAGFCSEEIDNLLKEGAVIAPQKKQEDTYGNS